MNQFGVLLKKEWREHVRNYKILWLPAVFVLFGIIEPVTQYFLPQIIESAGNLPEGAVFEFPTPEPEQVLVSVMGQYQFIGLIILILAYMGAVAGERRSGTATLLYVRPLSYPAYFLSKWVMAVSAGLASVWLGFLGAAYYIWLFFGDIAAGDFLQFAASYSLWIILFLTIVLTASAALPHQGLAAAVAMALVFAAQILDSLLGVYWTASPLKLPAYAQSWLAGAPDAGDFWWSSVLAVLLTLLFIGLGIWLSKRNAAQTKV
ncbi:ABC transporter permease [Indiicoccus explosivorum]|uniref:ABC transporter permease n=1 Tax=Indiicoccus explosivorum TaxID=1917864 RepID=UPI000B439C8E|nr:ABC transporter permease subunit [Indiicoccus explosivorum]